MAGEAVIPRGSLVRPGAERIDGARRARMRQLRGKDPDEFYPAAARRERIDGSVVVDLLVNEEGRVVEASIVAEDPPDMGFGLAALDVGKTYEFDNPLKKLVLMEVVIKFLP